MSPPRNCRMGEIVVICRNVWYSFIEVIAMSKNNNDNQKKELTYEIFSLRSNTKEATSAKERMSEKLIQIEKGKENGGSSSNNK